MFGIEFFSWWGWSINYSQQLNVLTYEDEHLWVPHVQMNLARLGPLQIFVRWIVNRWLFTVWISQLLCLSYFCFIFRCQNHFSLKAELWNQSKESPKWSSLSYWIFWSNGLAERNFVNADENNLLHLCHCSLTELKGSNIHMSCKKTADVIVNMKYKIRSLRNSSSIQLPYWLF